MPFFIFLLGTTFAASCEPGWTYFKGNCYKHIVKDDDLTRVVFNDAVADCVAHDSYLSPAASPDEWDFIIQLGTRPGNWSVTVDALVEFDQSPDLSIGGGPDYINYLLLGATRPTGTKTDYYWLNSPSTWFGEWCEGEPSHTFNNYCISMQFDSPCMWDVDCDNDYTIYEITPPKFLHYICKKEAIPCKEGLEAKSDGSCACKEGYFDITDLNIPDGLRYQKGEKCIPRYPCQNLTDLSIVFVVESSKSIGASNWDNMVTFLKRGSHLLNNTVNVGFVKFSTHVTTNEWLPQPWTQEQYLMETPSVFDDGWTNTPAGLDSSRELFKAITSNNKAAVLVTHSMPYVMDSYDPVDLEVTVEVTNDLRRDKIDLVILGYGEELWDHVAELKKLLANPRTDYFQFDSEASELKEMHMSYLLYKVCKRFK